MTSVVGSDSPNVAVFESRSASLGNVRAEIVAGLNERKIGRLPLSVFGGAAVPRSNSSQHHVSASPFGSLPEPVR